VGEDEDAAVGDPDAVGVRDDGVAVGFLVDHDPLVVDPGRLLVRLRCPPRACLRP
jgi:hypothetical protein